ncbi:hypothetical protein K438DRAFT_1975509 [Mycena galopus ATCC 62051]|nr:hypothetical protein K438DRAFT_1975509 [Mycena galopus ATCC 62051]
MKLIQLATLFAPFIGAVLASPSGSVLPRSAALEPVPRDCTLTFVCDGGIPQEKICKAKGYGCPDTNTNSNSKCAKDCGCLISCTVGPGA